jgi:hypothetical protein
LASISSDNYARFDPLELMSLKCGQILYQAGGKLRYVYFPIDYLISLLPGADERCSLEVGMSALTSPTA